MCYVPMSWEDEFEGALVKTWQHTSVSEWHQEEDCVDSSEGVKETPLIRLPVVLAWEHVWNSRMKWEWDATLSHELYALE